MRHRGLFLSSVWQGHVWIKISPDVACGATAALSGAMKNIIEMTHKTNYLTAL
jgi:hypothetical protein